MSHLLAICDMAIGMGNSDFGDFSELTERLLALRAVVAEAIASKAPRRTVARLGAAVATALFGAASPACGTDLCPGRR